MNQRRRSKEGSRARTASGPGRWRFILYVCKTHRHCVTHTHAPRLRYFVIFRRFSVFIFSFCAQYYSVLLYFVLHFCLQLAFQQKAATLGTYVYFFVEIKHASVLTFTVILTKITFFNMWFD